MPTTNHGYTDPDYREERWHEPLDNNRETYDRDIEIRDIAANLSNYIPLDGAKFRATDSAKIWIGDGTQWIRSVYRYADENIAPETIQVGNGDKVDSSVGSSGENEHLESVSFAPLNISTQNTNYTAKTGPQDRPAVPTSLNAPTNATNILIGFSAVLTNDTDGATTYARLYDETNSQVITGSEITATGTDRTPVYSTPAQYDPSGDFEASIQLKAGSGTATLQSTPDVHIMGKIQ